MRRRAWLMGVAGLVAHAAWGETLPVPASGQLAFEIWRKGDQIGTHTLTFVQTGDKLVVTIAVRIAIYFGPIRLFNYRMDGVEQWQDGQIAHIHTVTNDNGSHAHMRADMGAAGFAVQGNGTAPYMAPPHALPATHWNHAELDGPWINPQNGKLLRPHMTPLGEESVTTAGGGTATGRHYRVSGDVALDLWYDTNQRWLALSFAGKDGSEIRYLRRDV